MNKFSKTVLLSITGLSLIIITGCNPSATWKKQEKEMIQTYLKTLGDTVVTLKPSGLYYIELLEGVGTSPVVRDTVSLHYKGMFLDGVVFDSNTSSSAPFEFIVGSGEIILGIDEGVRYMKPGGVARLITPSSLAFGPEGIWGIVPGYTPLRWEIELISIRPGGK
jgi:FKBP-type peptidyl-prolyl cis-trans isomerase